MVTCMLCDFFITIIWILKTITVVIAKWATSILKIIHRWHIEKKRHDHNKKVVLKNIRWWEYINTTINIFFLEKALKFVCREGALVQSGRRASAVWERRLPCDWAGLRHQRSHQWIHGGWGMMCFWKSPGRLTQRGCFTGTHSAQLSWQSRSTITTYSQVPTNSFRSLIDSAEPSVHKSAVL